MAESGSPLSRVLPVGWLKKARQLVQLAGPHLLLHVVWLLYAALGATVMTAIENANELFSHGAPAADLDEFRESVVDTLWTARERASQRKWKNTAHDFLCDYGDLVDRGAGRRSLHSRWTLQDGLFYCMSVLSTIGYGHVSPRTKMGKLFTVAYGLLGIPLTLLVVADTGLLLLRSLRLCWALLRRCYLSRRLAPFRAVPLVHALERRFRVEAKRDSWDPTLRELVTALLLDASGDAAPPLSVAVGLLVGYLLLGALFFAVVERWSLLDAYYFAFVSSSTVGLGDLVPTRSRGSLWTYLYLLGGLALASMTVNVVQCHVQVQLKQVLRFLQLRLVHVTARLGLTVDQDLDESSGESSSGAGTAVERVELAEVSRVDKSTQITTGLIRRQPMQRFASLDTLKSEMSKAGQGSTQPALVQDGDSSRLESSPESVRPSSQPQPTAEAKSESGDSSRQQRRRRWGDEQSSADAAQESAPARTTRNSDSPPAPWRSVQPTSRRS